MQCFKTENMIMGNHAQLKLQNCDKNTPYFDTLSFHFHNADIFQNSSFISNQVLAGIVSKENFLECPFDLKSEKWSYYSDLGMKKAEENAAAEE